MTLDNFKHWFDGVVFAIGDRPTKEQWQMIKDKFAEADKNDSYLPFNPIVNQEKTMF